MRLRVLNSGSKANGYVLYNDVEALVIECGVPYSQCLRALDFKREKIVGAVVSHAHGDHCKYVAQYINAGMAVFASKGAIEEMKPYLAKGGALFQPKEAVGQSVFSLGGFTIMPFDTQHDCAGPFGFLIYHEEMGQAVFATDTYYLKYKFENLCHVMIECNYDTGIIERNVIDNVIPAIVKDRVTRSHMSLDTTIATLLANDLSKVNAIVLLHLSSHNSDADWFKRAVEGATGKLVFIAKKGLDIPFNKELL